MSGYGFDGNMTPLQMADWLGLAKLDPEDQERLIKEGFYTQEGHRIFIPGEVPHRYTQFT